MKASVVEDIVVHVPLERMETSRIVIDEWNRIGKVSFVEDSNWMLSRRLADAEGAEAARGDGVRACGGCRGSIELMLRL